MAREVLRDSKHKEERKVGGGDLKGRKGIEGWTGGAQWSRKEERGREKGKGRGRRKRRACLWERQQAALHHVSLHRDVFFYTLNDDTHQSRLTAASSQLQTCKGQQCETCWHHPSLHTGGISQPFGLRPGFICSHNTPACFSLRQTQSKYDPFPPKYLVCVTEVTRRLICTDNALLLLLLHSHLKNSSEMKEATERFKTCLTNVWLDTHGSGQGPHVGGLLIYQRTAVAGFNASVTTRGSCSGALTINNNKSEVLDVCGIFDRNPGGCHDVRRCGYIHSDITRRRFKKKKKEKGCEDKRKCKNVLCNPSHVSWAIRNKWLP